MLLIQIYDIILNIPNYIEYIFNFFKIFNVSGDLILPEKTPPLKTTQEMESS